MRERVRHEEIAYEKGYRVTPEGKVLGLKVNERKLVIGSTGYYEFSYRKDAPDIAVHRMQAFQKFGVRIYEDGLVVRHLDGNPLNNHIDNIGIGTQADNMQDRRPEVRHQHAMEAAVALRKATTEDVVAMRKARAAGVSVKELMARYQMSKGAISDIVTGRQRRYEGGPITPVRTKAEPKPKTPRITKLTDEDVVTLRVARAEGASVQDLSIRYGISEVMVSYIALGKKYKKAGGPLTRKCDPVRRKTDA